MIPIVNANWTTSLAAKMTSSASSFTLNRSTDSDSTTLSGTYYLTFDEGTTNEEHMIVSLAGSAGTVTTRGLSKVNANANVAANQFAHDRGSSVKMTNIALVKILRRLNGTEAFDSVALTGVASVAGLTTPTSGETTKAANVAYANALAIAGAPDASATTKGIVEIATDAQLAASAADGSGDTTAPLVAHAASFNVTSTASKVPVANASGVLDDGYVALTTRGDLVTRDATGLSRIAVGTANQYLTTNGTDVSWGGANLNEANTFFGATNITGAEAETLSNRSSANSLHEHTGFNTVMVAPLGAAALNRASLQVGFYDAATPFIAAVGRSNVMMDFSIASDYGLTIYPYDSQDYSGLNADLLGVVRIGASDWMSYGTGGIYKDAGAGSFVSGSSQGPLGCDATNSYLLMLTSTTNIRRFSGISGTALTQVDNITLDTAVTATVGFVFDDTNNQFVCIDQTNNLVRRFTLAGATVDTASYTVDDTYLAGLAIINNRFYLVMIHSNQGDTGSNAMNPIVALTFVPTTMTQ